MHSAFPLALISTALAVASRMVIAAEAPLPAALEPFFTPPPEFAKAFGDYRSLLVREDGSQITTPQEWQSERNKIRTRWHQVMGEWPALLDKPRLERVETSELDGFTQHKVKVEVAPGEITDGYLLIPSGAPKFPAVFVPFYDPETSIGMKGQGRDFAYQLTRRGFVTLSIGSPGGDARKPEPGKASWQPMSYLGYVAANCANALTNLPEVDAERIGVVGHSYGGKWAMFGSCLYDRFACAVWSDPGIVFDEKRPNVNYWDPWYLGRTAGEPRPRGLPSDTNPRTGAYRVMRERGMDLHELHALMAPRPFMVSGGSEDPPERWLALNRTREVNRLLGFQRRVAMTNRPGHSPTEESNEQIYRFFQHFLGDSSR